MADKNLTVGRIADLGRSGKPVRKAASIKPPMRPVQKKPFVATESIVGRKILVRAGSVRDLAVLLRNLALEIEEGHEYMNASSMYGLRIMRPLTEKEKDFYLSAKDLP